MKNFRRVLWAVLLFVGFTTSAQDDKNLWELSIGTNLVDFNDSSLFGDFGGFSSDYFKFDDSNSGQAISHISISRYLNKGFSLVLSGSKNSITKSSKGTVEDLSFFALDLAGKYDLNALVGETGWFDPYVQLGVGNTWVDSESSLTLNPAFGFNLWFNERYGFNLKSSYNSISIGNDFGSGDLASYFQHTLGLSIRFDHRKDTDGDGVYDKKDACPNEAGLVEFQGCPDSDSDGIADADDVCPLDAGLPEFNGCPDSDADGIIDGEDACPKVAGSKLNKGCPWPDTDKDGLLDKDDACPSEAGDKLNNGCPWSDTDGDGIIDRDDPCPNEAGPLSNNGCAIKLPEALEEPIVFALGKHSFSEGTPTYLNKVVQFMQEFSEAKLAINGHTCTIGSDRVNAALSSLRADAVKDYLVSKGIDAVRLDVKGFGYSMPLASNETAAGQAKNRRVELVVKK